jgi:hypothetical protein
MKCSVYTDVKLLSSFICIVRGCTEEVLFVNASSASRQWMAELVAVLPPITIEFLIVTVIHAF